MVVDPMGGHDVGGRSDSVDRSAGGGSAAPKHLKVSLEHQRLTITWQDGLEHTLALLELRRRCPCATCRSEREGQNDNPLRVLKPDPDDLRVKTAELVGNYAIRFSWSDGHDTGIFDFRHLRSLCEGLRTSVAENSDGS